MSKEDIKKQAIELAKSDIGLTEDEAEQAFEDHYPHDDNRYCDTCGTILSDYGEDKNCKDQSLDDYCQTCWDKSNKELEDYIARNKKEK